MKAFNLKRNLECHFTNNIFITNKKRIEPYPKSKSKALFVANLVGYPNGLPLTLTFLKNIFKNRRASANKVKKKVLHSLE